MLTEKEKEAVEKLDYFIYDTSVEKFNDYKESSKVILNLVTKLQDELIKLLKENRELTAITNNYEAYEMPYIEENDKIIIASKKYFANGFFKIRFTNKELIEEKDSIIRNIIKRLDNDINNISDLIRERRSFSTDNFLTDYSRVRLKAYRTKTKEIKELIEKEYFKKEGESDEKL